MIGNISLVRLVELARDGALAAHKDAEQFLAQYPKNQAAIKAEHETLIEALRICEMYDALKAKPKMFIE